MAHASFRSALWRQGFPSFSLTEYSYTSTPLPIPLSLLDSHQIQACQVSIKGIYPVSQGVASRVNGPDLQTVVSYVVLVSMDMNAPRNHAFGLPQQVREAACLPPNPPLFFYGPYQ